MPFRAVLDGGAQLGRVGCLRSESCVGVFSLLPVAKFNIMPVSGCCDYRNLTEYEANE